MLSDLKESDIILLLKLITQLEHLAFLRYNICALQGSRFFDFFKFRMVSSVLSIYKTSINSFAALTKRKQSFGAGDKRFVQWVKSAKGPEQHNVWGNCSFRNMFTEQQGTLSSSLFIFVNRKCVFISILSM